MGTATAALRRTASAVLLLVCWRASLAAAEPGAPRGNAAWRGNEGKPRAVTLDEALAYAEAHQPSLRAALEGVRAAQADTRIPRARWLPGVAVAGELFEGTTNNTTASYLGLPGVALPRIGATPAVEQGTWKPYASTLAAVSLTQELFDFGRIAAQSAAADAALESERQRAEGERLAVRLVVEEAYFAVQGAQAVLRAAAGAYERTRVHSELAKAGVRSGLFPPIELTRADADLARFDVNRTRAQGGLASAQVVLAAAVGAPDRMLDAKDETAPVAPLPSLEQAIAANVSRDPLLLEAKARIDTQTAVTHAIAAETRPELVLSGTFSGRTGGAPPSNGPAGPYDGFLPAVPNWDVGLVLRWPLYDGVVGARWRASAARERVLHADLAAIAQQELAAVQKAYLATQVAQAALAGLDRSVDAAHANYAQAEARWKAGLGTALELADAESLRTDAEIELAGGRFDLSRARAVLGRLLAETP